MITTGQFRLDLVGRRIEGVTFKEDDDGSEWTILTLDNGQEVHILDESPWVWVEPEVN
jgi:hypothetical protein